MVISESTNFSINKDNFVSLSIVPVIKVFESPTHGTTPYTVAIPTYGRSDLLKVALDSVLNQRGMISYEVIVVDNNPTRNDETELLMHQYGKLGNVSYYKNAENIGMTANWNRLFQLSKSEWTLMFHSDDILCADFMSVMTQVIEKLNNCDILFSAREIWKDKKPMPQIKFRPKRVKCLKLSPIYLYNGFKGLAPTGTFFRTKPFIESGGFNNDYYPSQDYVFTLVNSFKQNIYFVNSPLLIYRFFNNLTSDVNIQKKHIYIDYYLQKQYGKILRLPRWFSTFISKKHAYYRYRLIKSIDKNYSFNISDLRTWRYFYYLLKAYDVIERNVLKLNLYSKIISIS